MSCSSEDKSFIMNFRIKSAHHQLLLYVRLFSFHANLNLNNSPHIYNISDCIDVKQ